jgi:retron-type reverse transcriptase
MTSCRNLWPQVISFENLHRAARAALKGKRAQVEASAFHRDLERNLLALRRSLEEGRWRPGPYRSFWIPEPKVRLITAAPFEDRVVHHALVQVIEPVFERRFIRHSYACRQGKGTHAALARFRRWARGTGTVLKLDIHRFFPTIDHQVLKEILRDTLKDPSVLWLLDLLIDSAEPQEPVVQYFPGDDLFTPLTRRVGLPIGNLTSQFLANVYLDPLDHYVTDRLGIGSYLRYSDDVVLFHPDKAVLGELREEIRLFLLSLRLRLNERKSRVRRLREGIEFLGFVHLPDRTRLNSRNLRVMRRRLRLFRAAHRRGELSWSRDIEPSLQAWNAHAAGGDTWRLREEVFRRAAFSCPASRPGPSSPASFIIRLQTGAR